MSMFGFSVNAVIVTVPSLMHEEVIKGCLKAGKIYVFRLDSHLDYVRVSNIVYGCANLVALILYARTSRLLLRSRLTIYTEGNII